MHDRFLMLRSRILEAELPRDFRLLSFCELCFGVEAAMFTILRLDIAAACESLPVMRDDGAGTAKDSRDFGRLSGRDATG